MALKISQLTAMSANRMATTDLLEVSVDSGGGAFVSRKMTGTQLSKTIPVEIVVAASDETTALTTGTAKVTIDNTEKTSTTAATPAVISDTSIADDAEITIDIDQIGNGTAKGLKVTLIGYRN